MAGTDFLLESHLKKRVVDNGLDPSFAQPPALRPVVPATSTCMSTSLGVFYIYLKASMRMRSDQEACGSRIREWWCVMRKLILLLLLALVLISCSQVNPEDQSFPNAAELPTLPPSTETSTPVPVTTWTPPPVFGTAPTDVPPTFYYTPPPTQPSSTPAGSPTPTSIPGPEDYHISTFQMVDDQFGWAIFTFNGMKYLQDGWLGRTSDGGKTWTNVTPHAIQAIRNDPAYHNRWGYLSFEALDAENAWVFPTCSSSSVNCDIPEVIWRTRDGGRSWQTFPPPTDCQQWRVACVPWQLQFIDDQYGWMMMLLSGRNYAGYNFYRTIDGGESWSLMPGLQGASFTNWPAIPTFFSRDFGMRKNNWGIRGPEEVIDDQILPVIQITLDSGFTWREMTLPEPEGLLEALRAFSLADEEFLRIRPTYLSTHLEPDVICLRVSYSPVRENPPTFHTYYLTSNRGLSWEPLSMVGDSFFDKYMIGWRVVDTNPTGLEQTWDFGITWAPFPLETWEDDFDHTKSAIIHTTDGGATRTEILTAFSDERLWPGRDLQLKSLNMQSSMEGWAVEVGGESLCTQDGARTWLPCQAPPDEALPTTADLPDSEGDWSPDASFPQELFHGGTIPFRFQAAIDDSRQFLEDIDEFSDIYTPFQYRCRSTGTDRSLSAMLGVSRRCIISYPIYDHLDYGYETGYWVYQYFITLDGGEPEIWPNAVSIEFVDEQVGWRLLDMESGFYQLEKTEDGGGTWRVVKTVSWLGDLEFVSDLEGWVIALEPLQRGVPGYLYLEDLFRPSSLLHTIDGGKTWREILPVIGSNG